MAATPIIRLRYRRSRRRSDNSSAVGLLADSLAVDMGGAHLVAIEMCLGSLHDQIIGAAGTTRNHRDLRDSRASVRAGRRLSSAQQTPQVFQLLCASGAES